MNQTTPKTITLKDIFDRSGAEKHCKFEEFKVIYDDLVSMLIRDGMGMGKKVKLPFGIGTLKPYIYKPKKYKVDKKKSKELGFEVYDEWTDLDGKKLRVMWLNAYNFYPTISFYTFIISGKMWKLLRKYTGEFKLTERK